MSEDFNKHILENSLSWVSDLESRIKELENEVGCLAIGRIHDKEVIEYLQKENNDLKEQRLCLVDSLRHCAEDRDRLLGTTYFSEKIP